MVRRVRRRRNNNVTVTVQPRKPATRQRRRRQRKTITKRQRRMPSQLLSPAGIAFLKCAFAPPDFNVDPGQGIPDCYQGKVLKRKDVLTNSVAFDTSKDTYIIVLPTPGVAFWKCVVNNGTVPGSTDTFSPVGYPGFEQLFGSTANDRLDNVSAFRYASSNIGIYPTSNQMQFAGSITVWKARVGLSAYTHLDGQSPRLALTGLDSVTQVPNNNYAGSFIDGCFSTATCDEPTFPFSDVINGLQEINSGTAGVPFNVNAPDANKAGIVGVGNMDTIIVRIQTPGGATNSAIIKTWACLEYRANANSVLDQFSSLSPPLDLIALEQYRSVSNKLPVAVTAAENATLWERVKSIINTTLHIGRLVPGPVSAASEGLLGLAPLFAQMGF